MNHEERSNVAYTQNLRTFKENAKKSHGPSFSERKSM